MTATDHLGPTEAALYERMRRLSERAFRNGWIYHAEWSLWRALTEWRCTGQVDPRGWGLLTHWELLTELPELSRLQYAAGGWIWWLDGAQLVPLERWERLVAEREKRVYDLPTNDVLNREVP